MKLLFKTPNMKNICFHITNILRKKYNQNDNTKFIQEESFIHPYVIIEVSKEKDDYLITEMMQILINFIDKFKAVKVVETQENYYLSMSVHDIKLLRKYNMENTFIRKLLILLKDDIDISSKKFFLMNKKYRLDYTIDYNHNLAFHVLDDMKFFTYDYISILQNTDLTRELLNELFRITVRIHAPLYILKDIKENFRIASAAVIADYTELKFGKIDSMSGMKFSLSEIAFKSNASLTAVDFLTNTSSILSFIKRVYNILQSKEKSKIAPLCTYGDIFITATMQDLQKFIYTDKSSDDYTGYFTLLTNNLLYNNYRMEYILKGKERG